MLNSETFEHKSTFGLRHLISQVRVLLRSCGWRLSVIVTDVSITAAEIITRVDWTIVVYPSIRTDSPPPQLMSTTMGISELPNNLNIISLYSNRSASLSKFEAQLWAFYLLVTKRFELLMFTLVVTPEGRFSLSAIAETKAAFNTHALCTCICYSV